MPSGACVTEDIESAQSESSNCFEEAEDARIETLIQMLRRILRLPGGLPLHNLSQEKVNGSKHTYQSLTLSLGYKEFILVRG
jgi:hypothetical protein